MYECESLDLLLANENLIVFKPDDWNCSMDTKIDSTILTTGLNVFTAT